MTLYGAHEEVEVLPLSFITLALNWV